MKKIILIICLGLLFGCDETFQKEDYRTLTIQEYEQIKLSGDTVVFLMRSDIGRGYLLTKDNKVIEITSQTKYSNLFLFMFLIIVVLSIGIFIIVEIFK